VYTRPFVLAALANFLFFSHLNVYMLLPLYIHALGGRQGEIGAIMAMYSVAAVLCQFGVGVLIDRWGRKPFILGAAGILIAVSTAFVFSYSLGWHFYLLRFLQGSAFSLFITSNLTLLADLAPPHRRAEAVGFFGVSGLVAIAIAPAIGEQVLRAWGFHTLFSGSVLVAVVTLVVCLATPVPPPGPREAFQGYSSEFWRGYLPVLTTAFQFGLANSVVFVFLPPFSQQAGLPRIGPFYVLYTVSAVAVRFLGGRLADRFGRFRVIVPSLLGLASGVLLFSLLRSTWLLLVIGVINGSSHGFVYPAASALAFDRAPSGGRGRALAAFNMAALSGAATGAFGFGWLAQLVGYRESFAITGLLLLTGTLALRRRR